MATTAPNYICSACQATSPGIVVARDDDGHVTRWNIPLGWVLDAPPKPPSQGAKTRCCDCR